VTVARYKPIAITVGDPAGVGPWIVARAMRQFQESFLIFGDADQMAGLLAKAGVKRSWTIWDAALLSDLDGNGPSSIVLADTGRVDAQSIELRAPTREGGAAQYKGLTMAVTALRTHSIRALVTGPVSKHAVALAGHPFVGHTEFLAQTVGMPEDAVTMMFLGPVLKVALVTTHVGIHKVAKEITLERVTRTIRHLTLALQALGERAGTIAITGLNPHAGENGAFGSEELTAVSPAVASLQGAINGFELSGPMSAETAFRGAQDATYQAVVAMMHDQATIASKLLDWGHAVNVTWGLPYVRTSVDHGVAYQAAKNNIGDERGMVAAIDLALKLTAL